MTLRAWFAVRPWCAGVPSCLPSHLCFHLVKRSDAISRLFAASRCVLRSFCSLAHAYMDTFAFIVCVHARFAGQRRPTIGVVRLVAQELENKLYKIGIGYIRLIATRNNPCRRTLLGRICLGREKVRLSTSKSGPVPATKRLKTMRILPTVGSLASFCRCQTRTQKSVLLNR